MAVRDPYKYFRVEARELLEGLQRGVAGLETPGGDPDRIPALLRLAHTLKGAARVVRLTAVSDLAHRMEDILAPCRETAAPPPREQLVELHRLLAAIAAGLAVIDQPAPAPAEASAATPATAAPALLDTVRLQVAEVDTALAGMADLASELEALRGDFRGFAHAAQQARLLRALAARSRPGGGDFGTSARLQVDAGDLAAGLDEARQRASARVERLDRDLRRLHEDTGRLRLIPTKALQAFLERTVLDAAQALGKRVQIDVATRAPRLDSSVFAGLQEALLHLVRNAVAHGIETGAARLAAGKPVEGCIRVNLTHNAGRLRVVCEDDGGGIDTEAVRRAAVARGWIEAASAALLDMAEAIRLLLRGGVSTTRTATEMSGRGVGLDVARAAVARLGGGLTIHSVAGRGTSVVLEIPVALAAIEALAVESGGVQFLLPLESVQRVVRAESGAIRSAAGREELHLENRAIPYAGLHRLTAVRGEPSRRSHRHVTAVVLADAAAAIGVDRLLGATEAVVRPLPALAETAPFVTGASLGADGAPRLVLEARALAEAIGGAVAETAPPSVTRQPILVVDDSLTTRMLEQSILESAGYTVDLAVSGEDALKRLHERRYGLLLVDIEMPGMDGFALIRQLRGDPVWRDIPAILVTSRESNEDRQRGLEIGAQDYVIKGEFDQRRLLRRVGELLS